MSPSTALQALAYDDVLEAIAEKPRRRRRAHVEVRFPVVVQSPPLTLEELALAIAHRIDLPEEEAYRDAGFVMDVFGFDDRVIDNVLEREDRQLFYLLEEEGMLTTDREETVIWDGREWRTHYWALKRHVIKRYAENERARRVRREPTEADVYLALPAQAWRDRRF